MRSLTLPLVVSVLLLGTRLLGGCRDESTTTTAVPPPDGGALDAGCGVGRLTLDDGGCVDAGVPPEACGAGFEPDGDSGCRAILPDTACPAGMMAVPGDTACREIAPCSDAPWGDAPIDAHTVFVDQAYGGADADGSAAKPWPTIQQGIDSALSGATVAIAAGSYAEYLLIGDRPVTLWGRCPALVQVTGGSAHPALIRIGNASTSGTLVRGIELSGGTRGVLVALTDARLEQVWMHGASMVEVVTEDNYGPASLTIAGSLIEDAGVAGVAAMGCPVTVDASLVRDTQSTQVATGGGLVAQPGVGPVRASITLTGSVVERNQPMGVAASGADLQIDSSVIRDNVGTLDATGAVALRAHDLDTPSTLTLRSSLLARNVRVGLFVDHSQATVVDTTFTDHLCGADGTGGEAALVQDATTAPSRASLTMRSSRIAGAQSQGVRVLAAHALLEGVLVSDIAPEELDGKFGRGIEVELSTDTLMHGSLEVTGCVIARATEVGILIAGAESTIADTLVTGTLPRPANGAAGRALHIQSAGDAASGSVVSVQRSVMEHSHDVGVAVADSSLTFEDSVVRDVQSEQASGLYGDGLAVAAIVGPADITLRGSVVDSVARAGIACFGATVELERSSVTCAQFALDAESLMSSGLGTFTDLGGNSCGCNGQATTCEVQSAQLAPPLPLE